MKLSELGAGDLVIADDSFTCLKTGSYLVEADDEGRLFIPCDHGKHYLDGQVSFTNPDDLIGLARSSSCRS